MIREYRTVAEIVSPLMMVRMVENVTYDELVEVELPNGFINVDNIETVVAEFDNTNFSAQYLNLDKHHRMYNHTFLLLLTSPQQHHQIYQNNQDELFCNSHKSWQHIVDIFYKNLLLFSQLYFFYLTTC